MNKAVRVLFAFLVALLIFAAAAKIINMTIEKSTWVDQNGRLNWPDRGAIKYTNTLIEDSETYTESKVAFQSKSATIYALMYQPKVPDSPAIIIAPAARAKKEGQDQFARALADNGYAVFVLDQRGVGETVWPVKDPQEELDSFMQKKEESTEQLMIYDILKAFDVVRSIKGIDTNNIIVEGESMGGRFAMIAAAIEPRIKGVLIISSSGYGDITGPIQTYFDTVNPDKYVQLISPRKLVMFHSETDMVVSIASARATFDKANEPKEFVEMPITCNHGNCDYIYPDIVKQLESIRNTEFLNSDSDT